MNMDSFFFLRPLWLLLLIPLAGLLWYLLQGSRSSASTPWQRLVDPHLLRHLVVQPGAGHQRTWQASAQIAALGAGLLAATLALAGPTWQRSQLPTYKARMPVVMVLSLAQSMNATDLSPDRLTRAEHKVRDILHRSKGGDLALVVYSDQPFAATPLTSDAKVIGDMLPELSTRLMPVLGNRLDLAIEQATTLLTQASARQGQILVMADDAGEHPELGIAAAAKAVDAGYQVSVLGVGTDAGAALQTATGKTITDQAGKGFTTRLKKEELSEIASVGDGQFAKLTPDASDLNTLLIDTPVTGKPAAQLEPAFHADAWNDMGYWLLIIPLLLAPLAFRKNLLLSALPIMLAINLSVTTPEAQAAENSGADDSANSAIQTANAAVTEQSEGWSAHWNNMWRTPDQQAVQHFQADDFQGAARNFDNADWKASALYRDGQFEQAANLYASDAVTFDDHYNQGNALAKSGQLEQALTAYDQALSLKPGDEDAVFNRDLVAKLLEQQKQEEEEQDQQAGGEQSQDQQQAGGEQSQDQQQQADGEQSQDQQQAGDEQSQDQQQAGGEQSLDQQRAGGEQSQDRQQAGGEQSQDQQQAGDEQSQDQQQAGDEQSQDQQQAGGEQSLDQQTQDQQQLAAGEQAQNSEGQNKPEAQPADGRNAFQKAMDELLSGNGDMVDASDAEQPEDKGQPIAARGYSEQDQAIEQQLRAVPDDPSGLLRARIHQHYAQQRADRS